MRAITVGVCSALLIAGCGSDDKGKAGDTPSDEAEQSETTAADEQASEDDSPELKVESGFSSLGGAVVYGAALRNKSEESEAADVEVIVNALDKRGNVLATDSNQVSVIPPGEQFVIGGDLDPGKEPIDSLDIEPEIGTWGPPEHPLPKVSNVRLERVQYGGHTIRAQVENTLDRELSSITDVFGIVRDSQGKIVAGTYSFPTTDINPGSKSAVELSFLSDVPGAASAEVSVDNEINP